MENRDQDCFGVVPEHHGCQGWELASVDYVRALPGESLNSSGGAALSGVSEPLSLAGPSPCCLPSVRKAEEEILEGGRGPR